MKNDLSCKIQGSKKTSRLKAWYTAAFVILSCVFCICLYQLYVNLRNERNHAIKTQTIQAIVSSVSSSYSTESTQNAGGAARGLATPSAEAQDNEKLAGYRKLYLENSDMVGFVSIEGTDLFYPVMQTKDNPDYYLSCGFDKEHDAYGLPYIAEYCDAGDTFANVIIYGHNMKNGKMFGTLEKYREEAFYNEHKTVEFDTLNVLGEYDVLGVLTTRLGESFFPFHEYADLSSRDDFEHYTEKVKELSIYDTGVSPVYGRQLITLSTCGGSDEMLRIVLVGQKSSK